MTHCSCPNSCNAASATGKSSGLLCVLWMCQYVTAQHLHHMLNCDMTEPFWKVTEVRGFIPLADPPAFNIQVDFVAPSSKKQPTHPLKDKDYRGWFTVSSRFFFSNVATPHRCFQWVHLIRPVSNWAELPPSWCNVKTHCDNGPFHCSCVEMKSRANTGGTNESCDGSVPFSVAEPCQCDNKHWRSNLTFFDLNEREPSLYIYIYIVRGASCGT